MKKPFDIKYLPDIKDGKYKVETRDGRSARIICTDKSGDMFPIVALVTDERGYEWYEDFNSDGIHGGGEEETDLFLVTEEEGLTDFDQAVFDCIDETVVTYIDDYTPETRVDLIQAQAEKWSDRLLAIARKQIEAEKKRTPSPELTKIVENLTPEKLEKAKNEMEAECIADDSKTLEKEITRYWEEIFDDDCPTYFKAVEEAAKHFYNLGKAAGIKQCAPLETGLDEAIKDPFDDPHLMKWFEYGRRVGKAEALKDLPKWKTNHECGSEAAKANWLVKRNNGYGQPEYFTTNLVFRTDYFISIEDLEKLPKEE